ncbi:MAG: threonine ammonia-lyase [Salinirussus sp.]
MLDLDAVLDARDRVSETARHTPVEYSHTFSTMTGADVRLKLETFQRTGAFKIRGATNRIATLSASQRENGVVTASAGNHAQGVALAASRSGVDALVVMPETASISKIQATRHYGATVDLVGHDYAAAAEHAHDIAANSGRYYLHAFDDPMVMAGQGTIGLEILEDVPSVETVIVPIGGGGLIAGVATAIKGRAPETRVVGVQAEGAASAAASVEAGQIVERDRVDTIADGIATRRVGEHTFPVIQERVDEIVTVDDDAIAVALTRLLERSKTLVEGAGAVPLAALLDGAVDFTDDETIVPVLSGGNVDMNLLTTIILRGLVATGRYLRIRTILEDRPGTLEAFVSILSEHGANIYAVRHDRTSRDVAMDDAEVELDLETRGPDHVEALIAALEDAGYPVEILT